MPEHWPHRSRLRCGILIAMAAWPACSRPQSSQTPTVQEQILIYGRVTIRDSVALAGAIIRSVASPETKCDAHAHQGAGVPEEVRSARDGTYRQLVVSQGKPGCVRVTATSPDGRLSGYVTVAEPPAKPVSSDSPDSTRVDIALR